MGGINLDDVDLSKTITSAEPAPAETPAEKPATETPAGDPPADEPEGAEIPDLDDIFGPDEEAALSDLDKRLAGLSKSVADGVKQAIAEAREEMPADEPEGEDPRDKRIRELEQAAKDRDERDKAAAIEAQIRAAHHEMKSCIGKYHMTKAELDQTIAYFEKNPDLEGTIPFEQGALRVNPSLRDRLKSPPEASRNGSLEGGGAEIITRGGGGTPPSQKPPTFEPGRGKYGDVLAYLNSSGKASRMISRG